MTDPNRGTPFRLWMDRHGVRWDTESEMQKQFKMSMEQWLEQWRKQKPGTSMGGRGESKTP